MCIRDSATTVLQAIFECAAALNSMRDGSVGHGFSCGDGNCIDWHQWHVARVFSAPSSGCLVYGAFVAAVATMVSVLAWACLGCSFLDFCFEVLTKCTNDEAKPET